MGKQSSLIFSSYNDFSFDFLEQFLSLNIIDILVQVTLCAGCLAALLASIDDSTSRSHRQYWQAEVSPDVVKCTLRGQNHPPLYQIVIFFLPLILAFKTISYVCFFPFKLDSFCMSIMSSLILNP